MCTEEGELLLSKWNLTSFIMTYSHSPATPQLSCYYILACFKIQQAVLKLYLFHILDTGRSAQATKSDPFHTFTAQARTPCLSSAKMWKATSEQHKHDLIWGYDSHENTHVQGQTPTCCWLNINSGVQDLQMLQPWLKSSELLVTFFFFWERESKSWIAKKTKQFLKWNWVRDDPFSKTVFL